MLTVSSGRRTPIEASFKISLVAILPKKGCLSSKPTRATIILSKVSSRSSLVTSISGTSTFSAVATVIVPLLLVPYYVYIILYLISYVNQ